MQEFEPVQPQPYDQDHVRLVLEHLIDTCRDGEAGFADAAEHVADSRLRQYFRERSQERTRFARELEQELERIGTWQTTRKGSATGDLRRTWFDVKRALGGGDPTILDEVEAGEDAARDAYQQALREHLPPATMALIRTQAQSIVSSHDDVRMLRNRRRAA